MTPQDALDTVFFSHHPPHWYERLETLLQDGHAKACALPTAQERMQAHRRHFLWYDGVISGLAAREGLERMLAAGAPRLTALASPEARQAEFMELLQHHVRLVKSASAGSQALLKQVRHTYRERVLRRDLGDALCGTYPYRDADHGAVHVVSGEALSRPSRSGIRYRFHAVEPFIRVSLGEAERAALYQGPLRVQTLTAADLQCPGEQALIGQRGVFARTDIPAGVCLGVYGGLILGPVDTFLLGDYSHLISASDEPGQLCVNGETMMSLVNTQFLFDAQGRIAGHPEGGYNVEGAAFQVRTADQRDMLLYAYFTATPVAAGTELRVCYELAQLDGAPAFTAAEATQAA
ncbi:MAG TPA: hypothetical protein VFL86_17870 [Burkholderiaceae bacterium]|nr:hypothetical protein [Burkholderiaceae bacterium]